VKVVTKLRIFISSPGDVSEERALSVQVFERLAREYAGAVEIQVVLWEHEPLFGHTHFQDQIERPSQCDLVVNILWSRLGTRLPSNFVLIPGEAPPTGTEFEVRDALEAFKRLGKPNLLIYRKTSPPQVNLASGDARERLHQYEMLEEFCRRAFYNEQGEVLVAHRLYGEAYEFEKLVTEHARRWLERQLGELASRPRWTSGSPYRGLQVFDAGHRDIYFGRSQAIGELMKRMRDTEARAREDIPQTRFLLVQGMSGNGKSSLVRAGLLPLLEGRALEGIAQWRQVVFKPSDRSATNSDAGVMGRLADGLIQALPALLQSFRDGEHFAERLRCAPSESAARLDGYLAQEATQAELKVGQIRLVVFVDQLEELFGPTVSAVDRVAFAATLKALSGDGRIWVVATLRSDFASRLEDQANLMSLTAEGQTYLLGPPRDDELADMIREPARAAGLDWELRDGVSLDQAILRDASGSPESLPLLEYALERLYEGRNGRRLMYDAYERIGGLKGGIAATAESVLTAQQYAPEAFTRLMRALVSVNDTGTATRRYALSAEFPSDSAERDLLGALIEHRLCVTDRRGASPIVSFAHEALIQYWPRAVDWLKEEAGLLQTRELAVREALLWGKNKKADAWLAGADKLLAFEALESAKMALPDSVAAYIVRSRHRVRRSIRIRQLVAAGIVVLALAASTFGVRFKLERDAALRSERRAAIEAQTASATSDFLVKLFKVVDPGEARGNTITAREILDRGAQQIRSTLHAQPVVEARLMRTMGEVYGDLGLYGDGQRLIEDALAEVSRAGVADDVEIARAKKAMGGVLVGREDYKQAESFLVEAMGTFDRHPDLARDSALIRGDLGFLYWSEDDYAHARPVLEAALKRADASFGRKSGEVASILSTLGITLRDLGDPRQGLALIEESNEIYKDLFGEQYFWYAIGLESVGFTLIRLGRYEEAKENLQAGVDIHERVLGPNHAILAEGLQGLGSAESGLGQFADAQKTLERALAIEEHANGAGSKEVGRTQGYLAEIFLSERQYDQAAAAYRRAAFIARDHFGADSTEYATALVGLGRSQRFAGRIDDAKSAVQEALTIEEHQHHAPLRLAATLSVLADILCFRRPDPDGFALTQRAIEMHATDYPLQLTIVRSIAAYCDPDRAHVNQNEKTLDSALTEIRTARGPTAPQTEDAMRRIKRFHEAWPTAQLPRP
jgi:tetratricopeptide (TPR) repeat protein